MPKCCVVMCSARKNKNQPQLTLHRFPKNEALKEKWLEAIGKGNINPRQKIRYLCSLHFKESGFNKTLYVIRFRENSLPTIFPFPRSAIQETSLLMNIEVAKCKKVKTE
ncbi:hypothetical protein evm_004612 [Chilo suppressalis]|nr:hypothetical protein evm_004612 [Chilo suppressalis]